MVDWEKYEVPDWVVDDYNSRVPKEDRLPLGKYATDDSEDDWIPSRGYVKPKENKVIKESALEGTPIGESPILFWIFKMILFFFLLFFVCALST